MAEPHLDHPGEWHWFSGYGPAEVLGPCPHDCRHMGQSVIAWGPDIEHYELVQCDTDCGGQCRAWASVNSSPRADTRWLQVDRVRAERVAAQIAAALRYHTGKRQRNHLIAALRLLGVSDAT